MNHNSDMFIDDSHSIKSQLRHDCLLCDKQIQEKEYPLIVIRALERKYCANLNNHFYTKSIARILNGERLDNKVL